MKTKTTELDNSRVTYISSVDWEERRWELLNNLCGSFPLKGLDISQAKEQAAYLITFVDSLISEYRKK